MNYSTRLEKLQAVLHRQKLDAMLISQPETDATERYTGCDHGIGETSGVLLVPARANSICSPISAISSRRSRMSVGPRSCSIPAAC